MAEPTKEELKRICEIFLIEYNRANKTSYKWIDERSYVASAQEDVDAILFSENNKQLNIQYKEVVWDVEYDKIRNKYATRIIERAKYWAKKKGLKNISISTNFSCKRIPTDKKEIDKIGYWLTEIACLTQGRARDDKTLFEYDKDDYNLLEPLLPYISYYIVRKSDSPSAVFGFGWSKDIPKPHPHYADVFINTINEKILKVDNKNTIFILEAISMPLDEIDIKEIKEAFKDKKIGEVWILQLFVNNTYCFKV